MTSPPNNGTAGRTHGAPVPTGLTGAEAAQRLREFGPNAVPEQRTPAWRALLLKFWAPVPWMLEATIILQLALGKWDEALVIAALLGLNAFLSFLEETRADRALLGLVLAYLALLDLLKVPMFRALGFAPSDSRT